MRLKVVVNGLGTADPGAVIINEDEAAPRELWVEGHDGIMRRYVQVTIQPQKGERLQTGRRQSLVEPALESM
jgi:hypothetical protein